jgi:gamma-glutamyltranspeptidase / glutathione hydrolase
MMRDLTMLASHQCDWVEPIDLGYRGYALHEIGPSGQGVGALMALGMLGNRDLAALPLDSAESLHAQIEAMKLAFADIYRYVADPAAMRTKVSSLLDRSYLAERAKLIDMQRAQNPGHGRPGGSGTVYLTAADANGMMISYIQSNYRGFGSGVVVPGAGISMQNRGYDFKLTDRHDNQVGPRKRPFHTIIPGFVTQNGLPTMSFGVMGGSMQAQGHMQVMIRFADYKQNPQAAADAPSWRIQTGLTVNFEPGYKPEVYDELRGRGHNIVIADRLSTDFGRAQLIYKMEDGYLGASERRTDGQAVGF